MRRAILLVGLLGMALIASAQTVLREKTHGVLPGYPNPMIVTNFSEPGQAGENVTWDFSALPQVKGFMGDVFEPSLANPPAELHNANSCLVEDDLQVFLKSNRKSLKVLAKRVPTDGMLHIYNEPIVKMKYPFRYGDRFEGDVTGKLSYQHAQYQTSYDTHVTYSVEADAYGTLILPGSTLKNVLRVLTIETVQYSLDPNASKSTAYTYRWYVKEHRYPVLSLIFILASDGTLRPLKGAYNPIVQLPPSDKEPVVKPTEKEAALASIEVRPNPFNEHLTVSYTIKGTANVTIAVYNMQGLLVKTLMQAKEHEGQYDRTFTDQVQNLPEGLYIVRVEAAGNVLTQNILKIQ